MPDPYETLGVARTATQKEIKSAFRKLAKKHHPDQNPTDPKAKDRFAAANQAYEILGDEKSRGAFDRGEIDAEGKPRFQGFEGGQGGDPYGGFRRQAGGNGGFGFRAGGQSAEFDASDILNDLFGRGRAGPGMGFTAGQRAPMPGADISATLDISLEDAAGGGKVQAQFPDGRKLSVTLPSYVEDGQTIRLKGQGEPGIGGVPGDALVKLRLRPHPRYRIEGRDLHVEEPVALADAVLGAKHPVETLSGRVAVTVPPWSSSDKVLRLKGRGLPNKTGGHSDLYVHVAVMLPTRERERLEELMREARGEEA